MFSTVQLLGNCVGDVMGIFMECVGDLEGFDCVTFSQSSDEIDCSV